MSASSCNRGHSRDQPIACSLDDQLTAGAKDPYLQSQTATIQVHEAKVYNRQIVGHVREDP